MLYNPLATFQKKGVPLTLFSTRGMTGAQWRFSAQYRAADRGRARRFAPVVLVRSLPDASVKRTSPRRSGSAPAANSETNQPMAHRPHLSDLKSFTPELARAYLAAAKGDELAAAIALAHDRNVLDAVAKGRSRGEADATAPDDAEVHHALFLLRRAQGLPAPSFDSLRVLLRQRAA